MTDEDSYDYEQEYLTALGSVDLSPEAEFNGSFFDAKNRLHWYSGRNYSIMNYVSKLKEKGGSVSEVGQTKQVSTYYHLPMSESELRVEYDDEDNATVRMLISTPATISAYYTMFCYYERKNIMKKLNYTTKNSNVNKSIWVFRNVPDNWKIFTACLRREKKHNLRFYDPEDKDRFSVTTTKEIKDTFLTLPIMRQCVGTRHPYSIGLVRGGISNEVALESMARNFQTSNYLRVLSSSMMNKDDSKITLGTATIENISKQIAQNHSRTSEEIREEFENESSHMKSEKRKGKRSRGDDVSRVRL